MCCSNVSSTSVDRCLSGMVDMQWGVVLLRLRRRGLVAVGLEVVVDRCLARVAVEVVVDHFLVVGGLPLLLALLVEQVFETSCIVF